MTKIDVTLSDSEEGVGVFHDWRYTNDLYGGAHNVATLEVVNVSGISVEVEVGQLVTDMSTGKTHIEWHYENEYEAIRLRIKGALENAEFLNMLQLILAAEKMTEVIKP